MKIITDSPEHHFLTFIDKIKHDPGGWTGLRLALSRKLVHEQIIANPDHIEGKLYKARQEAGTWLETIKEQLESQKSATIYVFPDGDIMAFLRPASEAEQTAIRSLYNDIKTRLGEKLCTYYNLNKDIHSCQKLADERFLKARRIKAYEAMADTNKVSSIALRRSRHDDPVVLIVEDDRFTASYAANLLNKDYDVVVAKTGEEAILSYIEHVPDMVYLDIHLPGLNGHETLQAFRKIDPEAHVVMLSVDTVKQNIIAATKHGAAGFLKKPFTKERILAITEKSPFVRRIKQARSGVRA